VNVAARLEQLAEPGGITLSGTAYDHLQGKIDCGLEFLGEQRVKNIERLVRVYRVVLDGYPPAARGPAVTRFRLAAAALVLLLAAMGAGAWWWYETREPLGGPTSAGSLPLPDKPSLVVLPLTNLSGDPSQEYFSDGITEDIITALARNRELFVIASNSSFAYKDRPVDVRQVGKELGVRYVLGGTPPHAI
jgi:adenylate cyclase